MHTNTRANSETSHSICEDTLSRENRASISSSWCRAASVAYCGSRRKCRFALSFRIYQPGLITPMTMPVQQKTPFDLKSKRSRKKIISSDFYFDIISSNIYIESLKSRDIRSNSSLMPIETLNKIAGLFIGTIFVNCTQFFRPLLLAPCDRGGNISCSLVSYYLVVFQKQVVRSSRRGSGRSIGAILPWLRDMVRASRPSRTPITLRQVGSRTESTLRAQAHSKTYRLLQESVPTWNIQVYERGLSNHAK